jgi:DNA-binding NarL/FixJ family response regulator
MLIDAFEAGALAFTGKDSSISELMLAIEAAADGVRRFPDRLQTAIANRNKFPEFTPPEKQLMPFLAAGFSIRVVAETLKFGTERHYEAMKYRIRLKLGLANGEKLQKLTARWCDAFRVPYEHLKR